MTNNQLNKLSVPITPEQIRRTENDLATIKSLSDYAERNKTILVLSGGYATEALCGGNITRPHGDIDACLFVSKTDNIEQIFSVVERDIIHKEQTAWKKYKTTNIKIEFRENNDSKTFFDRRRLELKINSKKNITYFIPAFLVNSQGEKIKVNVVEINELLAEKIHKFYSLKDGVDTSKDRHTDDRDIYDLKRLLDSPDKNLKKIFAVLSEKYIEPMENQDSLEQAKLEYDYVMHLPDVY